MPGDRPLSVPDSIPEYRPKHTTDVWSTRERLCLASSVLRSGDQNWVSVSRAIRPFGENNRPSDWFSQKNCAAQYNELLDKVESPKRKRGERGETDTAGALIYRRLTAERIDELKRLIHEGQQKHKKLSREIEQILAGEADDRLEELIKQIQDEQRATEIAEQELQRWAREREQAVRASSRSSSQSPKAKRPRHEVRRSSSQSEYSEEPDSGGGSPVSIEVEDVPSPPSSQGTLDVEGPCTPQRKVLSPLPATPPTPPAVSTSLLTSLLKSPTPSSPISSSLCSLTPPPVHQPKEQSSPRTPSFFSQSAARQLAALSPSTTSGTPPRFSPTRTSTDSIMRPSSVPMLSPHSATSSAPTLSKLLELPPSTPGGCLPSLPFLTAASSASSSGVSQMAISSPLESSSSMDTTADDASVPDLLPSSPAKPSLNEEELTTPETPTKSVAPDSPEPPEELSPVADEPPAEVAAEELPEDPGEVEEEEEEEEGEDDEEEVKAGEEEEEEEDDEEEEEDDDGDGEEEEEEQTASSAEPESVVEAVASEEMVVETVVDDSPSSGINLDDDKESTQSDSERTLSAADQEPKAESESGREASQILAEQVSSESKDKEEDMEEQPVGDAEEESSSTKDTAKSETNEDEEMPLDESPDVPPNQEDDQKEEDEKMLPAADEEEAESKDAWAPETVSSPSPAGETLSNPDEHQSEDDDKLKDDKSSVEDAKTPETPSGTEPDLKDDNSQHVESSTEDGVGELGKRLLGSSVGDSVPNSPASLVQGEDSEVVRDYKVWKKSIMLVWRAAANHKYANVFLHPVTDEMAPGYHSIVYRPMDLLTIKKNIENGYIRTTLEFQRDMMLMFQNAIMYNSSDHDVFHMAIEMQKEVMGHIQDFLATQLMVKTTETKTLRERDSRLKRLDEKVRRAKAGLLYPWRR